MRKVFFLLTFLLVSLSLSATRSIYDVTSSFDESVRNRIIDGETVEYYSVYNDYVPSIAFDGTKAKEKAEKDSELDSTLVSGIATFVPYPESWSELSYEEKKLRDKNAGYFRML